MIQIRAELAAVESGEVAAEDSPLHHAPHTAAVVMADAWDRAYSRTAAAFPLAWVQDGKYWPPVSRVDNAWGDRHLFCSCNAWDAVLEAD
jgi:glycine dehydrogenase